MTRLADCQLKGRPYAGLPERYSDHAQARADHLSDFEGNPPRRERETEEQARIDDTYLDSIRDELFPGYEEAADPNDAPF